MSLKHHTYTSIDQQQIHAELVGFLLHLPRKADIITPVCTVVLEMSVYIHTVNAFMLTCSLIWPSSQPWVSVVCRKLI